MIIRAPRARVFRPTQPSTRSGTKLSYSLLRPISVSYGAKTGAAVAVACLHDEPRGPTSTNCFFL